MRKKSIPAWLEPAQAAIPRGQPFVLRLKGDIEGYEIHWIFNGQRIPGAHGLELSFYHVRPRYDGSYKALLTKGSEVIMTEAVTLRTLATNAQAEIIVRAKARETTAESDEYFFDPGASENPAPPEKKRALLERALKKTKKAA